MENFSDEVCKNYMLSPKIVDDGINIGYAHSSLPFIIIPSFALLLNLLVLFVYIRNKGNRTRNQ